ncbi:MAG TPA: indole-3-glycerol phosphate synthase TrpC [Gammaproteobacteria bacterium]
MKTPSMNILQTILQRKAEEIVERAQRLSLRALGDRITDLPPPRDFIGALRAKHSAGMPAVIAEIKKASPSQGVIRPDFNVTAIAGSYERGGAACLSVLTDCDFFQGADEYLQQAHQACGLPILRKDFTIDRYQVYEARAIGSDCILLIVAALGDAMLAELLALAAHLDMAALVEVHDRVEMERAVAVGAGLIGINNRNLRSFETRLETTYELMQMVGEEVLLVTESGIHTRADVQALRTHGIHTFLVGEALMRAADPGAKLQELFF